MEKRQVAALRPRVLEAMSGVVARSSSEFAEQDLAILATLRAGTATPMRHAQWGTLARLVSTYANEVAKAPVGQRPVTDDLLGCVLWMAWYQVHYGGSWAQTGGIHSVLDFLRAGHNSEAVRKHAMRELAELCLFLPEPALVEVGNFIFDCRLPGHEHVTEILKPLGIRVQDGSGHAVRPSSVRLSADATEVERDAMQATLDGLARTRPRRRRSRRAGTVWFATAGVLGIASAALAVPVLRGPSPSSAAPPVAKLPSRPAAVATTAPKGAVAEPMAVAIPSRNIAAYLTKLGVNKDGTLQVPTDFAKAGWYTGRSKPGEAGPAVIAGHFDSTQGPAVFYELHEVVVGDHVEVLLHDGTAQRWVVERVQTYPKDKFPTNDVYGPTKSPTLRLITCGGSYDRHSRSYRDNVIVYARLG